MKKFIISAVFILCLSLLGSLVFAQEFPPTYNEGPFPTGTEEIRGDAPCDLNIPNEMGTYHEYTAYRGTPVVDGDVENDDVWNSIPWTAMDSYNDGPSGTCYIWDGACDEIAGFEGWEDISAWFKVLWDDDHVYFALKKYDNQYVYNEDHIESLGNIWQDDAYQIVLNTNDPENNDGSGISTEVGLAILAYSEEAFNVWGSTPLVLADGNSESVVEICNGKAFIGSQVEYDDHYTEVIEVAFDKWDEIVADEPQMFSIMCNDPDDDHDVDALQWSAGIFSPKSADQYASIVYSSSEVSTKVATNPVVVRDYQLDQNYPNPFNPSTRISFSLPQNAYVSLVVYNMLGQRVKTLMDQSLSMGVHQVQWDGTNDSGQTVTNGLYFYTLRSELGVQTCKMMFMK